MGFTFVCISILWQWYEYISAYVFRLIGFKKRAEVATWSPTPWKYLTHRRTWYKIWRLILIYLWWRIFRFPHYLTKKISHFSVILPRKILSAYTHSCVRRYLFFNLKKKIRINLKSQIMTKTVTKMNSIEHMSISPFFRFSLTIKPKDKCGF